MTKKMNALTLSGLMIGPILGSGILFLPPLAYKTMGLNAIYAWLIIMALGALFAYVFAHMASLASDNRGVSAIVGTALGEKFENLSANYLTAAVLFGPVAVAITAADFIISLFPGTSGPLHWIAAVLVLIISALLILSKVSFMSRLMLILSSIIAALLLVGGMATLLSADRMLLPDGFPQSRELGQALLLTFWAIVGWEVLGNYAEDIDDSRRTMMRAMRLSLFVIVLVYISSALAVQSIGAVSMAELLVPIFGPQSNAVFGSLAVGLCVCTIVTFMGAVARQLTVRAQSANICKPLQKKQAAAAALLIINLIVFTAYAFGLLTLENIIGTANTLFIGNAFLGLIAGLKLIKSIFVKIGICILLIMMLAILAFSPLYALLLFAGVSVLSLVWKKQAKKIANEI